MSLRNCPKKKSKSQLEILQEEIDPNNITTLQCRNLAYHGLIHKKIIVKTWLRYTYKITIEKFVSKEFQFEFNRRQDYVTNISYEN